MSTRSAVHITVHGHVQGVGFRYFIKNKAEALRLTGWVRNRIDDSVEMWAEGPRETLQQLVEIASLGPNESVVIDTNVVWVEATDQYSQFQIVPTE